MVEQAGLLVSLGGDGTMLRSMRLVEGHKTPVLGVNVGRLGFLAEVDLPDLRDALSAIDGAACKLGTSREELLLSLEPKSGFGPEVHWTKSTLRRHG